jgi:hypothetical protein
MKKITYLPVAFLAFLLITTFIACDKNAEAPADIREKFYGTYTISGSCDGLGGLRPTTGKGTITAGSAANEIFISATNANAGTAVKATVTGNLFVVNPGQSLISGGVVISFTGSGSTSNSGITFHSTYSTPGIESIICDAVWTK